VQVAKVLVLLHNELLQGSAETLEKLRRLAPAGLCDSKKQKASIHYQCLNAGYKCWPVPCR